jgi:hypothetical protein
LGKTPKVTVGALNVKRARRIKGEDAPKDADVIQNEAVSTSFVQNT